VTVKAKQKAKRVLRVTIPEDKSLKKAFTPLVALLVLLLIAPAMATPKTKSPFTSKVNLFAGNISMGQQQITQDGIMYVDREISTGTISSVSEPAISGLLLTKLGGVGDQNAGQGSFHGKFRISNDVGTFEGSVVGVIITTSQLTARISGSFVGFGRVATFNRR
jgi:hypothetical protein